MSSPNGLSERILILGDEPKSALALQRLLATAGYGAVSLASPEVALEELQAREASLIIIESSASRLSGSFLLPSNDDSGESLRRLHWAHLLWPFAKRSGLTKRQPIFPF